MKPGVIALLTTIIISPLVIGNVNAEPCPAKNKSEGQEIGKEYPPSNEGVVLDQLRKILTKDQHINPGPFRRGQHPKQQACLKATLNIKADIPSDLKYGVFAKSKEYGAIVRFSLGQYDDDRKRDVHGIAIKLLGVAGDKILSNDEKHSQDFIMADNTVFLTRDAAHLLEFVTGRDAQMPLPQLARKIPNLLTFTNNAPTSQLEINYWSQTPYRLGTGAVKYSLRPHKENKLEPAIAQSADFLQQVLLEVLTKQQRTASFDFLVQAQTDANKMPIEDASVTWSEILSKPTKVATLRIPAQVFNSAGQMAWCEQLSFTPWHSLPEHRPLGGINRARRLIYQDSNQLRHQPYEPTGNETF